MSLLCQLFDQIRDLLVIAVWNMEFEQSGFDADKDESFLTQRRIDECEYIAWRHIVRTNCLVDEIFDAPRETLRQCFLREREDRFDIRRIDPRDESRAIIVLQQNFLRDRDIASRLLQHALLLGIVDRESIGNEQRDDVRAGCFADAFYDWSL